MNTQQRAQRLQLAVGIRLGSQEEEGKAELDTDVVEVVDVLGRVGHVLRTWVHDLNERKSPAPVEDDVGQSSAQSTLGSPLAP